MKKLSKRYKQALAVADLSKGYAIEQAVEILGKMPKSKFDETIELSARLGLDPRQSDQMVRGTVVLPSGSGKTVRVIVFTENPEEAIAAGAQEAGLDNLIAKVSGGWLDFDVAISTTSAMKQVRTVARVLGPRGLMPNPKSGTVTDDIASGIKAVMGGRVEFKMDKTANVAVVIGKRSFTADAVAANVKAAIDALAKAKPEACKGKYIRSVTISGSMTPGVALDAKEYAAL